MKKSRYIFAYPCINKYPPLDTVYTTNQKATTLREIREIRKLLDSLTEEGQRGAKIYKLVEVK